MGTWQSGFSSTGIHYTRTGGDKPPLVLAHGFTDSGLCWTRTAQALEESFDVIMPDARGHGLTPLKDGTHTAESLGDDLSALIEDLDLGRPPVVGHSMGAATAFAAAADHPNRVGAIVLVDPPWRLESEEPRAAEFWLGWKNATAADKEKSESALRARVREEGPTWHDVDIQTKMAAIRELDIRVFDSLTLAKRLWRDVLPDVTCPALLIWADGGIVAEPTARVAESLAPNLTARCIENSGHCIQRDQFDAFLDTVRRFLDHLS
jgi:pimeloyl-ACP methyl ester carboxylesterase